MQKVENEWLPVAVTFTSFSASIAEALDRIGAADVLSRQQRVMIKPNLIANIPPPVTTPSACCEALVDYVRRCSEAEVIIAEGCGAPGDETDVVFEQLGYVELARRPGVDFVCPE